MTESQFVALNTAALRQSPRARGVLVVIGMLGLLMLFSPYSIGIGLLVIALATFGLALPRLAVTQARGRFVQTPYLHGPVRYGISSRGLWVAGEHLSAESSWQGLTSWREEGRWVVLFASGMPPVYLPREELKSAGVYDRVATLARTYGRAAAPPAQRPAPPRAARPD